MFDDSIINGYKDRADTPKGTARARDGPGPVNRVALHGQLSYMSYLWGGHRARPSRKLLLFLNLSTPKCGSSNYRRGACARVGRPARRSG